jgi:N-acetylglucosaminyl-diphospho-decaprenol L-rhamnosyltransferase
MFCQLETTMESLNKTAIIIVSFCTPDDVVGCLNALRGSDPTEPFDVYITENGGSVAYAQTVAALRASGFALAPVAHDAKFLRVNSCLDDMSGAEIHYGEAGENLGYAGGINLWLRILAGDAKWKGFWVLNPDTVPDNAALRALVAYAKAHEKGMVGSQITFLADPDVIATRGVKWRPWVCRTLGVDKFAPAAARLSGVDIESRIDAPSGASVFITRECLRKIGPMAEDYFLYFEDLEWGLRAKAACGIGCAEASTVRHVGGSSIGSSTSRKDRSPLSVYLDHRNRLLFVRRLYPRWYAWTVFVVLARTFEFLAVGSWRNFCAALSGWWTGLTGETGRPDRLIAKLNARRASS